MCLPQVVLEMLDREQRGFPCVKSDISTAKEWSYSIVEVETRHIENETGPMFVA